MKTQTKIRKLIAPVFLIIILFIAGCNNQSEKINTMQSEIDNLKSANDSMAGQISEAMKIKSNQPAGLVEIDAEQAKRWIGQYKPSPKPPAEALRGLLLYYKDMLFISSVYETDFNAQFAANDDGITTYVLIVKGKETTHYYTDTFNKDYKPGKESKPTSPDTAMMMMKRPPPTCPPCVNCPPCGYGAPVTCCTGDSLHALSR